MTEANTYSPLDDQQIDRQIQRYQAELDELKKTRQAALKKEEGFNRYLEYLETLHSEYGISEEDIFNRRSVQIGDWITTALPRLRKSDLLVRLEKFIGDRLRQQARKKPLKGRPQPARELPPGEYRHPMSLETVEKKTRAPKQLNDWVLDKGLDEVLTWKVEPDTNSGE